MKDDNLKDDPQLSRLLKTWQVDEALPPRFEERVWKRIEAAESGSARAAESRLMNWLAILFARPAFATVVAALLLVAGLTTGFVRASQDAERMNTDLAQRYVASVNPYANPAH